MSAVKWSRDRKCVQNGNVWGPGMENIPSQSSELWVSLCLKRAVMVLEMRVCSTEYAQTDPQEDKWKNRFRVPWRVKPNPSPPPANSSACLYQLLKKFQLQPPQTQTDTHFPLFPCHTDLSSVQPPLFPHRPSRCYTMTSVESRRWYQPVFI